MSDSEARERLAELMEERRLELHLTWREVADAAGVSYEAVRDVRSSRTRPIRPLTRRGIDRGLQWQEGAGVDAILAGDDPVPAGEYDPFLRSVREEIAAAGPGATGAEIFRGQSWSHIEATIWDAAGLSEKSRTKAIAALRADRARYESGRDNHRSGTGLALAAVRGP